MRSLIATALSAVLLAGAFAPFALAANKRAPERAEFVDFRDQLIDGVRRRPTALLSLARKGPEFDRLLRLRKTFEPVLLNSARDRALR